MHEVERKQTSISKMISDASSGTGLAVGNIAVSERETEITLPVLNEL